MILHSSWKHVTFAEKNTEWANKAELYVGLLKESIRKDLRESHCPMVLWDYYAQRRALIHYLTLKNLFATKKILLLNSNLESKEMYQTYAILPGMIGVTIVRNQIICSLTKKSFPNASLDP